jgi:hypothetical protein
MNHLTQDADIDAVVPEVMAAAFGSRGITPFAQFL